MLASYLGLPRQSEILIIIFLGICFLSLDFSLFELRSNLEEIWKIELEKSKYLETGFKYIISAIFLIRTFTLHAFLGFYVVMLWPAIFEEKPNLMLPWLLLGIIRCLILNGITFLVGTFICQKEKGLSPICLEFILAQLIEHGPSIYAWMSVLSFYRQIAVDHGSLQSSAESLCSDRSNFMATQDSQGNAKDSEDGNLDKTKSYSLSDLNFDYLYSNRVRSLSGDVSIEVLINELRDLFAKKRIIREGSKSFDSLIQDNASENLVATASFNGPQHSILEKTMRTLDISHEDILKAKEKKNRFLQLLKEISVDDVSDIDNNMSTKSISKSHLHKKTKTHILLSHSQTEDVKGHETCLCFLRKLQLEQSNQTLLESEIANITFYENDKQTDKPEDATKRKDLNALFQNFDNDLNQRRVVVGSRLGFNPNVFLQKFVLKKNTSKNFGCQVSMLRRGFLEESRNQLAKKLVFLRNFSLS